MPELLFERGYLVPTRAALDLVEEHQVDLPALLTRHVRGDGGEVGEDGVAANQDTLRFHVGTVLSSYIVTPDGARLRVVIAFTEQEASGGQAGMSASIENYLGFPEGLSGGDLARHSIEQAQRFESEFLAAHAAASLRIDHAYRVVVLEDGTELYAYAVLLTTGVEYRMLDAPGAEGITGRGVYYGAASAEAAACRHEDVYVLGGGNSAGQAVVLLSRYARTVTVVTHGGSLTESMSEYLVERIGEAENVRVRTHSIVSGVEGVLVAGVEGVLVVGDERAGAVKRVTAAVGDGAAAYPVRPLLPAWIVAADGPRPGSCSRAAGKVTPESWSEFR